jgi:hypothetical protein
MLLKGITMTARDQLINIYYDWVNNYLTQAKFAEHNGLTEKQAEALLSLAQSIEESEHPEA